MHPSLLRLLYAIEIPMAKHALQHALPPHLTLSSVLHTCSASLIASEIFFERSSCRTTRRLHGRRAWNQEN